MFSAFLAELTGGSRPTLVVIEDVHWADEATLDLLRFLGRRLGLIAALLIVTYRDDEVGPRHPLRIVMGDLATSAPVRRMTLPTLSETGVRALAAGSELDPVALHRQTGGNPFFVTEVLAAGAGGIPPTVRDAVLTRAARLSPSARAALAAAVIGSPIEPPLLDHVVPNDAEAIDECVSRGMLHAASHQLTFRHELAREAVLEAIPPLHRVELHARVLSALRPTPFASHDPARLAHHAEGAGDQQAVLEYAPAAAQRASEVRAHREAAAQYARALRFSAGLSPRRRALLLEARATECSISDQLAESIAARQAATALWQELGNPLKEGAALSWLANAFVGARRNADAEKASRSALDLLERLPPGPELASAYQLHSHLRMLNRDNAEAIVWGMKARDLAERCGDIETILGAANSVGSAILLAGNPQGHDHLEESLGLAREAGLDRYVALAYANLGSAHGELYQFKLADRYLVEDIAYAVEHDIENQRLYMLAWRALSLMYQGSWTEAAAVASSVLRHANCSVISRIVALVALGRVRARRGDPEVADTLDQALALTEPTGTLQRLAPVRAARAEAVWLAGDQDRARTEAAACFDLALHHRHR